MRKLVLQMSISLDGYLGSPGNVDDGLTQWILDTLDHVGTHIMGRVTYHEMAAHWPASTDAFAAPMNTLPKVVFSQTLEQANWHNTRVARGDIAEEIARLKQQPGKDILAHGGVRFAQSLMTRGLVDEYRLMIHPAMLGTGERLFPDRPEALHLTLLSARSFASGVVVLVYSAMRTCARPTSSTPMSTPR